ncbi:MAG: protein phosphatase 2C domain-containing protein [Opitutaceae bacterium]|nr:protein phosphatase 2C domain-containing protein [Opitutaceae bacterium]
MILRTAAHSDIGHVRSENEDSYLCDDQHRLYAVADGIGGLPAGKEASELSIKSLEETFAAMQPASRTDYLHCLDEINASVFQLGRTLNSRLGIGTTLTVAHLSDSEIRILHVGDTSLFRLRAGRLEKLTTDHILENEMQERLARGESMLMLLENRQALTRCVGQPPPIIGDYCSLLLQAGDRYLLCSDGITRAASIQQIESTVSQAASPQACVQTLIDHSNACGGLDNATVVAIFVDSLE